MVDTQTQQALKQALKASQTWWDGMGVEIPELPPATPTSLAKTSKKQVKTAPRPAQAAPITPPEQPEQADRLAKAEAVAKAAPTLEALKTALEAFDAGVLSDHAQNMVFARGNPEADIMAIGESPGKQEDETGLPFVGEAGKLLNKMFAAIKRDESNLYITNVCNWRPPGNRNPSEDELALCRPFIRRHIELISPKIVVIVGGVSLQALTGKSGIMKTRGQWQNLEIGGSNIPAMPLYHPAFLLRRPELKKQAWQDLLTIQNRIAES
jgi:DNA polymerase